MSWKRGRQERNKMWGIIITYAYKYLVVVREQKESGPDYYASAECMHQLDVKYVVIFIGPHVHNNEIKRTYICNRNRFDLQRRHQSQQTFGQAEAK